MITREAIQSQFEENRWHAGMKYANEGRVIEFEVTENDIYRKCDVVFDVSANVSGSFRKQYMVRFQFFNGRIRYCYCNCKDFSSIRYQGGPSSVGCKHIAAVANEFLLYMESNDYDFYTPKPFQRMMESYMKTSMVETLHQNIPGNVKLEPKLEVSKKGWEVSFRIGEGKLYAIKDLKQFYFAVKESQMVVYGKDVKILHHMDSFIEESKPIVAFILSKVEESLAVAERVVTYGGRVPIKRSVILNAHSADEFFRLVNNQTILCSGDRFGDGKKARSLLVTEKNPKFPLTISPRTSDEGEILGANIQVPEIESFYGDQYCYFVTPTYLYQTDEMYGKHMKPFLQAISDQGEPVITIGKGALSSFYINVLPEIRDFMDIEEINSEQIEQVLPPEPKFRFNLDVENKITTCEATVTYGVQTFPLLEQSKEHEQRKQLAKSFKAEYALNQYFHSYDPDRNLLFLDDEDQLFLLIDEGIDLLTSIGEVNITDAFKRQMVRRSPKISIGVGVENDLLNLTLDSDEFQLSELADVLKSYHKKKKFHRLKDGSYLKLNDSSFEMLAELFDGLQVNVKDFTKGKLHIPAYRALYLDRVLQESQGIDYERNQKFKEMVRDFKSVSDSDYEVPRQLRKTLRTYQKTGYRWLRMLDDYGFGGILADDMGLGKTLQVITFLLNRKKELNHMSALIVCPASLVYNWDNEFKKFANELRVGVVSGTPKERKAVIEAQNEYDILVTSYDLLRRDIELYESISFTYQIIDEAQYIKNHATLASKAVKIVSAKQRFALTGTPIENRLSELWSIFDYLMPGFLYRYDRFKKDMETPIVKEEDDKITMRLKRLVSPFILRRLKSDVLKDLPDKLEEVTFAKMDTEQQKIYDAYVAKVRSELMGQSSGEFESSKIKILSELTRLRQICCDPSLVYDDFKGESAKLNTCMELIQSAIDGGHKILLFSQFTSMLSIIGERLSALNIPFYEITGSVSKEKRMKLVNEFNENEVPIFLISLKAGGTGLNLTGADIVIHYDPWWNVAAQNQATDRAHRIGQKNKVTVYRLIASGTIEEKILLMQEKKKQLADQIISGEENKLSTMTKDDFMELIG